MLRIRPAKRATNCGDRYTHEAGEHDQGRRVLLDRAGELGIVGDPVARRRLAGRGRARAGTPRSRAIASPAASGWSESTAATA